MVKGALASSASAAAGEDSVMGAAAAGLAIKRNVSMRAEAGAETKKKKKGDKVEAVGSDGEEVVKAENPRSNKGQLAMVTKLVLQLARQQATLEGTLVTTILFTKDNMQELINKAKDTTTSFFDKTKEMGADARQQLLSPHIFLWFEFLSHFQQHPEVRAHWSFLLAQQKEYKEKWNLVDEVALRVAVGNAVRFFRLNRTYNPKKMKLQMAITEETALGVGRLIQRILVTEAEGELKFGTAPKGDLERKLEKFVQKDPK
eukprot:TRINITY_DN36710_c0_g4_i1.p2 TRINITY_DN36710_c0_g4~~TRINITY_DN36710_c0_g4_i1.p2  ORF type:complete len:259 (-),score=95.10 TRINITY_DN36710_c0_g4_i1:540-1316(-)